MENYKSLAAPRSLDKPLNGVHPYLELVHRRTEREADVVVARGGEEVASGWLRNEVSHRGEKHLTEGAGEGDRPLGRVDVEEDTWMG